jgi:predicted thioredoxin/glutaredoxin
MRFASLFSWLRRKLTSRCAPITVHFFTRKGCHLCDLAWEEITRLGRRYQLTLEQTDVDTDLELAARHGDSVPVVVVNGKVRFRGGVNPVLLERLFRAESRKPGDQASPVA